MCSYIEYMEGVLFNFRVIAIGITAASLGGLAVGQELIYQPNNPSFGGNPFNSAHLLGVANSQNGYEAPEEPEDRETQSEIFLRQLQSRLLSGLASQVSDAIFGDNPQDQGTIAFDDQVINFVRGLDSVTIMVDDLTLGTSTTIVLPLFATGS